MGVDEDPLDFFIELLKLATFLQVCRNISVALDWCQGLGRCLEDNSTYQYAAWCLHGGGNHHVSVVLGRLSKTSQAALHQALHMLSPNCLLACTAQFVTCGMLFYSTELWGHFDTGQSCTTMQYWLTFIGSQKGP
jgi:hypothetical protein